MFLLTFTSLTISLDSSLDLGIDKTFWVYGHNPLEFCGFDRNSIVISLITDLHKNLNH